MTAPHSVVHAVRARASDYAVLLTALAGVWLFWSQYSRLSTLDWWYGSVPLSTTALVKPDYDLASLPWKAATPHAFDLEPGRLTLVTDARPYAYQLSATVNTNRARAAIVQFEMNVESGGTTVGLLQSGQWIGMTSSQGTGLFSSSNAIRLGGAGSVTVMIANDNPAGQTRVVVNSVRLYLRR